MTITTPSLHLHVEQRGTGEPLVLVHGSWGSRDRWALVEDELAHSFRVVTYDRRGHGFSDFGDPDSTRRDDEADLAWLIEALGAGPVHLVGTSYGGSISLGLAARRPDLVRSVCVHEPPLVDLAADDALVQACIAEFTAVAELIDRGERRAAARRFVERVALGPGGWEMMPADGQQAMVNHAEAFVREARGPNWGESALGDVHRPVLLTAGQASPAWFAPVMDALRTELPAAASLTILGAGHIPHITHAGEYVDVISDFALG
jgi:pimeloyl-ACP methyl ester carboxylesterase